MPYHMGRARYDPAVARRGSARAAPGGVDAIADEPTGRTAANLAQVPIHPDSGSPSTCRLSFIAGLVMTPHGKHARQPPDLGEGHFMSGADVYAGAYDSGRGAHEHILYSRQIA
jgi:hypothetical protein